MASSSENGRFDPSQAPSPLKGYSSNAAAYHHTGPFHSVPPGRPSQFEAPSDSNFYQPSACFGVSPNHYQVQMQMQMKIEILEERLRQEMRQRIEFELKPYASSSSLNDNDHILQNHTITQVIDRERILQNHTIDHVKEESLFAMSTWMIKYQHLAFRIPTILASYPH